MIKEQKLNFLKNNRTLNKGKIAMKNILNINCIKNKRKNNDKKFKNFPLDKFLSIKNSSSKKINDVNLIEKNKKYEQKRNFSYIHNFNRNNCTINNNINYSNNNNINVNMINNNISINNGKILTKLNTKYDFNKNKIRKKMILSEINSNLYNTNLTSLNNEISKITGENNITSYFDINNKNIIFEKQNKNFKKEKNLTGLNSYRKENLKKSEENNNKTKIIFINCQKIRRNNRLENNSHTQTQNNLHKNNKNLNLNLQCQKRKFNNSQKNMIMNNIKKSFFTTYLYNGICNSKNNLEKKFKFNSNNSTLNKNSKNQKYFNLIKENSILNLTGSFNSQKHIFRDNLNLIFDNDNDLSLNKILKKNKSSLSSFIDIKKYTNYTNNNNRGDIHLKFVKDLVSNKFSQDLNKIQIDFDKSINMNKNSNSKIKKYKIIKNSFNNFLKLLNQTLFSTTFNTILKFLEKIYFAYEDLFNAFLSENQKYKKMNNNINEQKYKIDKKLKNLQNIMVEKQNKLKHIEQKFLSLLDMINKNNNLKDCSLPLNKDFILKPKSTEEGEIISTIEEIDQELKNGKIFNINKNNLDDLDALYFFDKIKMAPQRSYSEIRIPNLNIDKKNKNIKKRGNGFVDKTKTGIINISDIKFTSNYFNKFKQAFEKDEYK